jgi:hypothetical protein
MCEYNHWRKYMKSAILRFISLCLLCALLPIGFSGCSSTGSEFIGKWVNKANPNDTFQVVRNGEELLIVGQGGKIGATYENGALEVKGVLLSVNLTYDKQTDTLLGQGLLGNVEYKRLK